MFHAKLRLVRIVPRETLQKEYLIVPRETSGGESKIVHADNKLKSANALCYGYSYYILDNVASLLFCGVCVNSGKLHNFNCLVDGVHKKPNVF